MITKDEMEKGKLYEKEYRKRNREKYLKQKREEYQKRKGKVKIYNKKPEVIERRRIYNKRPEVIERRRKSQKKYREIHREQRNKYSKEWRQKNKSSLKKYPHKNIEKNKLYMKDYLKEYRKIHKKKILNQHREYNKKHSEQIKVNNKEYSKTHRNQRNKYFKGWYQKNKEKYLELVEEYRKEKIQIENERRKKLTLPLVGEGWTSEMELLRYVHILFQDYEILTHHRKILRDWGKQGLELDIFIPQLKLAFEYMGRQHYEFIEFFHNNQKDFEYQQYKDRCKKKMCRLKGIKLIRIKYDEKPSEQLIISKLKYVPHTIKEPNPAITLKSK